MQTVLGIVLNTFSEVEEMAGNEGLDIMIWASRVHYFGHTIVALLSSSGLNVKALVALLSRSVFVKNLFASNRAEYEMELLTAKLIYYGIIPALRFYTALWLADTWVFFIHRAEHSNKWLYSK
jgi:sphinganine C4-monooxygenase